MSRLLRTLVATLGLGLIVSSASAFAGGIIYSGTTICHAPEGQRGSIRVEVSDWAQNAPVKVNVRNPGFFNNVKGTGPLRMEHGLSGPRQSVYSVPFGPAILVLTECHHPVSPFCWGVPAQARIAQSEEALQNFSELPAFTCHRR